MLTGLVMPPQSAPGLMRNISVGDQCLGRLAAVVDASPTDQVLLDCGHHHAMAFFAIATAGHLRDGDSGHQNRHVTKAGLYLPARG